MKKKIAIISASPKVGEASVSAWLADRAQARMLAENLEIKRIDVQRSVQRKQEEADFETMRACDAFLIVFPLYFFCLPGLLMRFLQDYHAYIKAVGGGAAGQRVYCTVNCGFKEPEINEEAVRVLRSFSAKIGGEFRFGLMIGGGGMLLGAKDAPFMKKLLAVVDDAFRRLKADVLWEGDGPISDVPVAPNFPRGLYHFMGNLGWKRMAKKHGLNGKNLYAQPYR